MGCTFCSSLLSKLLLLCNILLISNFPFLLSNVSCTQRHLKILHVSATETTPYNVMPKASRLAATAGSMYAVRGLGPEALIVLGMAWDPEPAPRIDYIHVEAAKK